MKRILAGALALAFLVAAGCGDDDDASSSDDPTVQPDEDGGEGTGEQASGDSSEFCPAWSELMAGDPTPDAIREVAAIAPEGVQEPLEQIAEGFESDEAYFETEEFQSAFADASAAAGEECADEVLEVAAIDYGYEGIPAEMSAGTVAINLTNEGTELHEAVVLRKNDGVTESAEELLQLPEEEAMSKVTEAGVAFAFPGAAGSGLIDMTEPGEYLVVCFIPTGSTPDAGEEGGDGPPHFTQGMVTEVTVS